MKTKKPATPQVKASPAVYRRIRDILESARAFTARSVNTTQVVAYWLIGREIVEEEQRGKRRAGYGERLLEDLSARLKADFGGGFSVQNLRFMRQFYSTYPHLLADGPILHAVSGKSARAFEIRHAVRSELESDSSRKIRYAVRSELSGKMTTDVAWTDADENAWLPGRLHVSLSWTMYRRLVRVDSAEARAFYEIEAIKNNWAARELERQIDSLLYERLAMSKDKDGLMRLATKGQVIQTPTDVFKDPVVIEFLGLPESPRLKETDLEAALISNLQAFLLELGKGFAFLARQARLTLDGDHFYVDLVFYHTILKCYVLIDLKVGKLTHADLGQLQLYVNFYDQERRAEGDSPTLGLILCSDKNDAVVRYMLGQKENKTIFASRYKLYLPSETELANEIKREVRLIAGAQPIEPGKKK